MSAALLAPPLLDANGARVILGAQVGAAVEPLAPRADTLFGPRGACLAGPEGPLFVCDTGHHRVLVWHEAPRRDATAADMVIGHADFSSEGRGLLDMPSAVAVEDGVLAIADSWNHRVLIWHELPRHGAAPPHTVIRRDLFWCYGVALREGRLLVADTGNKRVLVWDRIPRSPDAAPDRALAGEMRWPHAIACIENLIFVADAGVGVLAWRDYLPVRFTADRVAPYGVAVLNRQLVVADTAASRLLGYSPDSGEARALAGQRTFAERGDNRWRAAARDSLCWPYGVSACGNTLVIADTGNNRVLLWDRA